MAACEHYEEMISAYLDNELTEAEKSELMAHVSDCPSCASLLKTYTLLFSRSEPVSAPKGFTQSVMGAAGVLKAPQRAKKRAPIIRILALGAACLLLVAAVYPIMNAAFGGSKADSAATGAVMNYSLKAADSADEGGAFPAESVEITAEVSGGTEMAFAAAASEEVPAGGADYSVYDSEDCCEAEEQITSDSALAEPTQTDEADKRTDFKYALTSGSAKNGSSEHIPSIYVYGDLPDCASDLTFYDDGEGFLWSEVDTGLIKELIELGYEYDEGEIVRLVWYPDN